MKKRSLLAVVVLVAMLSVVVAATAGAGGYGDGCGEGCTPGYWKQPHHFGNWVGYSPDDLFNDVFGGDWYDDDFTLLDALEAKGWVYGSELIRHGVAALLNVTALNYPEPDPAIVIWWVNYGLNSGDFSMAGTYVDWNEDLPCPLGRAE